MLSLECHHSHEAIKLETKGGVWQYAKFILKQKKHQQRLGLSRNVFQLKVVSCTYIAGHFLFKITRFVSILKQYKYVYLPLFYYNYYIFLTNYGFQKIFYENYSLFIII